MDSNNHENNFTYLEAKNNSSPPKPESKYHYPLEPNTKWAIISLAGFLFFTGSALAVDAIPIALDISGVLFFIGFIAMVSFLIFSALSMKHFRSNYGEYKGKGWSIFFKWFLILFILLFIGFIIYLIAIYA